MTTFFHSLIYSLSLSLYVFRHTHTVSICRFETLRYLTRSNVTVRTRATVSPKMERVKHSRINAAVSGGNLKCKTLRSANRKIFETAYPAISLLTMSDRFEEELRVSPALSILCCQEFSQFLEKKNI